LPNGGRVWRLRVTAENAYSLHAEFSTFDLRDGAELYVYDDARENVLGQYNALNVKANREFQHLPIPGTAVTYELVVPPAVEEPGALTIGRMWFGYRDVFVHLKAGGGTQTKGSCETDVNCPAGAGWENQRDAVMRLLSNGSLCTGSMLNNTSLNGDQLFITANHCGNLNNAVFLFNYQRSGCGTGSAPSNQSVQGSTQLATSSGIDYRLVRITPTIPSSYGHYLAGWDRSGTTPPNTATIHHPQGLPKKISFDDNSPGKSGTDWRIFQWDLGVTQPGSSGCPLYDHNRRFIGQLWGGAAACGYPFDDYYGRLQSEWSQVQAFLDPAGTGQTAIDGLDPNAPPCPMPTTYGSGELGSSGSVGTTGWSGVPSASTGNFAITASGFSPNAFGVVFLGTSQTSVPTPGFTVLVGNVLQRIYFQTDASGAASIPIPVTAAQVGFTRMFQCVGRDPGFGGNLQGGNGVQATFCP
ncbi:MAG: trypsin-like serine peptidase, partial [Planctomycetota bacterium JB042]